MSGARSAVTTFLIASSTGVLLAFGNLFHPGGVPSEPQTFDDVIAIAKKLGWHYQSDSTDGTFGWRLVVSTSPRTQKEVNGLMISRGSDHADWKGIVAIYRISRAERFIAAPEMVRWGSLFLFGDRNLIDTLMRTKADG